MLNTSAAAADLAAFTSLFSGRAGCCRVAVAVSGGSDSMALLVLAVQWAARTGIELAALTVDHGLRDASHGEAQQVGRWSQAMGIAHHILVWPGTKPRSGIQAAARAARYDLMTAWCRGQGYDALLTAHTMDDQAETVAMRASRTTSPKSLAGIWPEMTWQGVRVLRPLLAARREDLRLMLRQTGQGWIDDPSNDDVRFERVRVRKTMDMSGIGNLAAIASAAQETTVRRVRAATTAFEAVASVDQQGCVRLGRAAFDGLDRDMATEVLGRAIHMAGAGQWPLREKTDELLDWLAGAGPGAAQGRRTLAGAVICRRKADVLVAREAGRIAAHWVSVKSGMVWDGRFFVTHSGGTVAIGPRLLAKDMKKPAEVPIFVWNGLPTLKRGDGTVVPAGEGAKFGVSVEFRERKWF